MFQAAKQGDLVIGVDLHLVLVPSPTGPIPTPLPHLFTGRVYDPLSLALAAASVGFGVGGSVLINGSPVANTGMDVRGEKHIPTPPGTSFAPSDQPDHQGTIVTGSKTVSMGGSSCARLTSLVSSCNFPLNLPTSTCIAVPMGAPVLIGGPPAMDKMAAVTRGIRTKWFSNALHKVLKPGKRLSKLICFLTGHPVDVVTGEVLTDAVDFELPGPLPLVFERNYYSRDRSEGPLGPGWHHSLNASVQVTERLVTVRLPDGRESGHDRFAVGKSVWDAIDRYTLEHTKQGYRLTFWDGLRLHFEPVKGAPVTHALVKVTDRCENVIALRYRDGRLAEVTDCEGRVLEFITTGGRLTSVRFRRKDGERFTLVRYEYEHGRLAAAVDPKGNAAKYAYRGGVLVKETNRSGFSFYFEYDWEHPDGYCIHTWGDGGIYDRRITYDKYRYVTLVDDSRKGRTQYWGNAGGLVDRERDPTGVETRYEWDERCRKVAEIDGLGNKTEWAYDARGNTILERDALGNETRWTYNELNVPVEHVDAAGHVWKRVHDARGMLTRAEDPLGHVTRFKHDGRGRPVSVEDPRGRKRVACWGEGGAWMELTDWEGHPMRREMDELGRVVRRIDVLGKETKIERDACGLPIAVRWPDGSMERGAYDPEGNLIEHTDALGNVTQVRYGGFNKLVEQIDPAGGVVRYAYDTEESLIGITNEAGEEYRFEVDLAGRVVKEIGFDGRTLEFWYDRAGRCYETVNAQMKRTKLERDAVGRVVKQVIPRKPVVGDPIPQGEEVLYAHDALGRLVRAKNDVAEVLLRYDPLGRVVKEELNGHVVERRVDAAGDLAMRRTSLGHETSYALDGNGDLLSLTFGSDPRWMDFSPEALSMGGTPVRAPWKMMVKRDADGGEKERTLPGGVVSRWERDKAGRPTVHRVAREDKPLLGAGYQWRSSEQLAGLVDTQLGLTRFEHDARSYLVAATRPDGTFECRAPDVVGNVYRNQEQADRAYGKGGVLHEAGGAARIHDLDGQLVEKVMADGKRWKYVWDFADQLIEVTRPDGQKVSFGYDPLGRRLWKAFAGKTTTYVWDGNDLVHEVTEGESLVTWEFEPGTFAPMAKVEGEKRFGVVTDHIGTPRVLLDEAGAIAWKAQLDLHGMAQVDMMKTGCPWRWPGQYEDEETGLYYNRFRYYDPEAGRYISQDPIGLAGGLTLYGYVRDPFQWADPFGLVECDKLTRQTRELTEKEIADHVFDRHADDFFGGLAKKGRDLPAFMGILDRLRKSNLTFRFNLAASPVIGHLARYEGKFAAIFFFDGGKHPGEVASAFFPGPKQLSRIFKAMSRKGP